MLNESIHYESGVLHCDAVPIPDIAASVGTPVYIYSLKRALANLRRIQTAFATLQPDIHYSAKANANLAVLRTLVEAGAGIDAVSAGEIHRALLAGTKAEDIVFAGVGKTPDELAYALEKGVGWINVENVGELDHINRIAAQRGQRARAALRLNPDVTANTHPYIATGHGGAKFGLTAETVGEILARKDDYAHVGIEGIHLHIGSQLHDTEATQRAVEIALELIAPYPHIQTVNIGGGLPVAYRPDEVIPTWESFAETLTPLLKGYKVILEPGRSIIADAGILVFTALYIKEQAGQRIIISDGSMAELIRPALYQAHHEIVAVDAPHPLTPSPQVARGDKKTLAQVVGPVCETADVIGREMPLQEVQPGDLLAALTAGAYGMVMASNYNQRLRPAEVVVEPDGESWRVARRRETWDDLVRNEV
jgi:diaminopimelate decarboxylase